MTRNAIPYEVGTVGICPHCGKDTKFVRIDRATFGYDIGVADYIATRIMRPETPWISGISILTETQFLYLDGSKCFLCSKPVLFMRTQPWEGDDSGWEVRLWPLGEERTVSEHVPASICETYKRAGRLVGIDSTAAAAFARTCLEKVLDQQGIPKSHTTKKGKALPLSLDRRLEEFAKKPGLTLPGDLSKDLQLVRQMGNFIHLNESMATGQIVEVANEEAIFVLDILGELFDVLYTAPARRAGNREQVIRKIQEVWKHPG
jgi:hypothetical protein